MAEDKAPETAKKSDFKIILIGLVFFLIAMGGSYFYMRTLMAPLMPEKPSEKQEASTGNLISIGEFTTNINDVAGTRFLKVEVYVEVAKENKKSEEELTALMPIVKDSILSIISSKTAADLDVRNRENLKKEIRDSLNRKIGSEMIKDVYFTNFIMQ